MKDSEEPKKDEQQPRQRGEKEGPTEGKPSRPRAALTPLLILAFFVILFLIAQRTFEGSTDELSLNEFYTLLTKGKIGEIKVLKEESEILLREEVGGSNKRVLKIPDLYFIDKADLIRMTPEEASAFAGLTSEQREFAKNLKNPHPPEVKFDPGGSVLLSMLSMLVVPLIIFALLWFLLFRQVRGPMGTGSIFAFGKSRAKLSDKNKHKVTFEDVAGIEEAKEEVKEIIEFLRSPGKFRTIGARIPKGVLLVGQPGTGKTLLAKAIAGEADVPFFSISGSDFVEMFVGVGASRVRDLFKQAKSNAPCIIFLDEIDAVGRRRGSGLGGGHDEREQTLNAILVEMDGFDTNAGIIMVAATNRPDILDPALLRPGRFDREIVLDLPDLKGREAILKVHARNVKIEDNLDFSVVARMTPMFSGAELEALINEAALLAVMRGKQKVDLECLEEARDKVRWGREKKSRRLSEDDRKITAYHESGHALLANLLPDVDPLHKVTIIPRGFALGATMQLPKKDRYTMRRKHLLNTLKVLLGGYVAESIFCDDISSGSQSDIKNATELVRLMVCEWGMSSEVGPINYSAGRDGLFLGKDLLGQKNYSEATAQKIDEEVKRIITSQEEEARALMLKKKKCVNKIAEALLKYESLTGEEVRQIIEGADIDELRASAKEQKEKERKSSPRRRGGRREK